MDGVSRLLVADIPEMGSAFRAYFAWHQVVFVESFAKAVRALEIGGYDAILIGLRFDDSRMFELLAFIRSSPQFAATPVFCVRGTGSLLGAHTRRAIEQAVGACGARFIECRLDEDGRIASERPLEQVLAKDYGPARGFGAGRPVPA